MDGYLFSNISGIGFFEQQNVAVANEVASLGEEELKSSDDSLKIILKSKHQIKEIEFRDYYQRDGDEVPINVRDDPRFNAFNFRDIRPEPLYKTGKRIEIHLPFSGDYRLFNVCPSSYSTVFPRAAILENELVFTFDFFSDVDTPEQLKQRIDSKISTTKRYADSLNNDIRQFNQQIEGTITFNLQRRKEKLRKDAEFIEGLDIPGREEDVEVGFVKLEKKLQLKIVEEVPSKKIDPSLELDTYKEILEQINSFGISLERSSKRIRDLDEESLRDNFLCALNSVYKGMVSGEAFNKSGKTDILLKYQDSNLYVAECKIWKGDSYFNEGIDQLLSYLTWRDSKTSYIIFSKNRDVTKVIEKAKDLLRNHPNFVREDSDISESSSKYVFKNVSDEPKELYITLHVFDLSSV